MSRDYVLKCIKCAKKEDEELKNASLDELDDLPELHSFMFLEVNCDVETDKMIPFDIKKLKNWIAKHEKHGKIAFEVII